MRWKKCEVTIYEISLAENDKKRLGEEDNDIKEKK